MDGRCVICGDEIVKPYRRTCGLECSLELARRAKNASTMRWRLRNPDAHKAHLRKWRKDNPEKRALSDRKYWQNHKEKIIQRRRERRANYGTI